MLSTSTHQDSIFKNMNTGATAINQGTWILETPSWLKENVEALVGQDQFFDEDVIMGAFNWATDQMAQVTEEQPATGTKTFVKAMAPALETLSGIHLTNMDGHPVFPGSGTVFRPFTIFETRTGYRRSADTILDRDNANLDIMTETKVEKILFDGDDGIPSSAQQKVIPGALPTARCVQFVQGGVKCVKLGGRIYISAGAFHTPEILMKSGIGRDGVVVDNDEVRQSKICDAGNDSFGLTLLTQFLLHGLCRWGNILTTSQLLQVRTISTQTLTLMALLHM
jgi:choline dehydrogenase-like flavoprotein